MPHLPHALGGEKFWDLIGTFNFESELELIYYAIYEEFSLLKSYSMDRMDFDISRMVIKCRSYGIRFPKFPKPELILNEMAEYIIEEDFDLHKRLRPLINKFQEANRI